MFQLKVRLVAALAASVATVWVPMSTAVDVTLLRYTVKAGVALAVRFVRPTTTGTVEFALPEEGDMAVTPTSGRIGVYVSDMPVKEPPALL